jgi:hypothetical protein
VIAPGRSLRIALLGIAAVFLAWELYGTATWLGEVATPGAGLARLWAPVAGDRMLQVVTSDFLLIGAVVLALLWLDAAGRGWAVSRRAALALGFIALGSPVLLTYIALRNGRATGAGRRPGS